MTLLGNSIYILRKKKGNTHDQTNRSEFSAFFKPIQTFSVTFKSSRNARLTSYAMLLPTENKEEIIERIILIFAVL